ncbi:pyridoxal-phosphate dependent enzyme [Citricoccus muralis]|uniref:Pyridoxal-phosphate dependent enzyme n=1 Tax=Citricoccus muralis TaxID=169134 RepID=A0ABY8H6F2_9MICC|nr:pyridoxal-phosphate dependent enzyme [Citricoccus muralis]WFP16511.1 pyridoxal-phosphate dependent enzyme [Citricoccus muralis]
MSDSALPADSVAVSAVPTVDDVRSAADVLDGVAHRTPVLTSTRLNRGWSETAGREVQVFLKAENLQRIGAFKFRGAYNALHRLPAGDPVVAYSSGNHAQAVALAARLQGRTATIVMPEDSPAAKLEATLGYGAEVVPYDRYTEDRVAMAEQLAAGTGGHIIPPFDHPHIAAGQGTAALELFEDVAQMSGADRATLDALLVPCGGAGLLAGSLLAAAAVAPECAVYGVEPEAGDDVKQSLERGERVTIPVPQTIADGAQTAQVGAVTFPVVQAHAAGILTVSDAELVDQMRFMATYLKTVVEPTGCLGLAGAQAWLAAGSAGAAGSAEEGPLRIGVVLSGGNIDLDRFAELVRP